MARLRDDHHEFARRGVEILAVGPDGSGPFRLYWRAERLPFVGLPDPDHQVAVLYQQEVNVFKLGRMPLLLVIDATGMIRFVHHAASMSDIPDNQTLLYAIDHLRHRQGPGESQ